MTFAVRTLALAAVFATASSAASAFEISFDWGDIPLCTTGDPNTVDNPTFTLTDVPEGTVELVFKLTDLDVPGYNHGGGDVEYTGQSVIEPGAFRYKSPCPPSGSHTYRWTVKAKDGDGFFAGTIAEAEAEKSYP